MAKKGWGNGFYALQHLKRHVTYFPLCAVAQPHAEKMEKLPGIHSDHDLGLRRIGKDEPCVFPGRLKAAPFVREFLNEKSVCAL